MDRVEKIYNKDRVKKDSSTAPKYVKHDKPTTNTSFAPLLEQEINKRGEQPMKKLFMIQKTETIGNKRRTTTMTNEGITVKEVVKQTVKETKDNGPEIPEFMLRWQEEKRRTRERLNKRKTKQEEGDGSVETKQN